MLLELQSHCCPVLVAPSLRIRLVRFEHPLNTSAPIVLKLVGNVISESPLLLKALLANDVNLKYTNSLNFLIPLLD